MSDEQPSHLMELLGTDETDPAVLEGKKIAVMRAVGALPPKTHVIVNCRDVGTFSAGIVGILLSVANLLSLKGAYMGCINLSPEALESLRSHPGGETIRVCSDAAEVAHPHPG